MAGFVREAAKTVLSFKGRAIEATAPPPSELNSRRNHFSFKVSLKAGTLTRLN